MPGGVCAVLDYEVDLMAEYIAEMATRVVTPDSTVTAPFRKFVSQILTSTRLPSTTILLGMNYLAKRINMIKQQDASYSASEGQVWRFLTVALLLGSKFLDDNTFQNRSWSEVSGIAVSELNSLEFSWLSAISWNLYVNFEKSKDYTAWLDSWKEWQHVKKRQQVQVSRERLAPLVPAIDTELARYGGRNAYSAFVQQQAAEFEHYQSLRNNDMPQPAMPRYREVALSHNPWQAAPLTPPDSGYGTPEYSVTSATSTKSYDWFTQPSVQMPFSHSSNKYQQPPCQNQYYVRHQNYAGQYYGHGHGMWEQLNNDCNCKGCVSVKQPQYLMAHAYGQPVMG